MRRQLVAALALLVVLAPLGAGNASAQSYVRNTPSLYGRGYRPLLSPYLNLLRGGDPAINYYLGTLPEIQRRQNDTFYQQQIADLEKKEAAKPGAEEDEVPAMASTGLPVAFGTTRKMYNDTSAFFPPVALPPNIRRMGGQQR